MTGVLLLSMRLDKQNVPLAFFGHRDQFAPFVVRPLAGDAQLKPPFPISLSWILAKGFSESQEECPA